MSRGSHSFYDAMNERYAAPAWALFYEVGDGTGRYKNRSADAIAMSLYPSRGLDLYGHEFKANRGDWLNELKNPDKAESIAKFCDYWYVVDTSGGEAVKEEEVPASWGLIVWNGKTLRAKKQAQKLNPEPVNRIFIAGLLRAANKSVNRAEKKLRDEDWVRNLDSKSYDRGYKTAEEVLTRKWGQVESEMERLKRAVKGFEEVSGIQINSWNWGDCGKAVRLLQRLASEDGIRGMVENAGRELSQKASDILDLAKSMGFAEKKEEAKA